MKEQDKCQIISYTVTKSTTKNVNQISSPILNSSGGNKRYFLTVGGIRRKISVFHSFRSIEELMERLEQRGPNMDLHATPVGLIPGSSDEFVEFEFDIKEIKEKYPELFI